MVRTKIVKNILPLFLLSFLLAVAFVAVNLATQKESVDVQSQAAAPKMESSRVYLRTPQSVAPGDEFLIDVVVDTTQDPNFVISGMDLVIPLPNESLVEVIEVIPSEAFDTISKVEVDKENKEIIFSGSISNLNADVLGAFDQANFLKNFRNPTLEKLPQEMRDQFNGKFPVGGETTNPEEMHSGFEAAIEYLEENGQEQVAQELKSKVNGLTGQIKVATIKMKALDTGQVELDPLFESANSTIDTNLVGFLKDTPLADQTPRERLLQDPGTFKFMIKHQQNAGNNQCVRTGCSGQLCVSADQAQSGGFTTCEFKPEYACYQQAECGITASGECGWLNQSQLNQCITQAQAGNQPTDPSSDPMQFPAPPDMQAVSQLDINFKAIFPDAKNNQAPVAVYAAKQKRGLHALPNQAEFLGSILTNEAGEGTLSLREYEDWLGENADLYFVTPNTFPVKVEDFTFPTNPWEEVDLSNFTFPESGDIYVPQGQNLPDGVINSFDALEMIRRFGNLNADSISADLNHDNQINTRDLAILLKNMNQQSQVNLPDRLLENGHPFRDVFNQYLENFSGMEDLNKLQDLQSLKEEACNPAKMDSYLEQAAQMREQAEEYEDIFIELAPGNNQVSQAYESLDVQAIEDKLMRARIKVGELCELSNDPNITALLDR